MKPYFIVIVLIAMATTGMVSAADYARDIKPLLKKRCVSCHGPLKQKAGLRVDVGEWILKGSDDGVVVSPGDSAGSTLIDRVSSHDEDERMPSEGVPLTADEIGMLAEWNDDGVLYPHDEILPVPGPGAGPFHRPQGTTQIGGAYSRGGYTRAA